MNFFHKLFNPHCPECAASISEHDKLVDVLRTLLENEKREKEKLLDSILKQNEPVQVVSSTNRVPIRSGHVPWRVKQNMLEQEDKALAAQMRSDNSEIENLEEELGVKENG